MKKKIMAICLAAIIAITAIASSSLAYLTDSDSKDNVFTFGNVDIKLEEVFDQNSKLIPGQDINKDVNVKNTGSEPAYVRVHIAIPAILDSGASDIPAFASYENILHWNFTKASVADGYWNWNREADADGYNSTMPGWPGNGGDWNFYTTVVDGVKYNVYIATYETALESGATTATTAIDKVYLDTAITNEDIAVIKEIIGDTPIIKVAAEACQTNTFEGAYDALNTAFGIPTATSNPWVKDSDVKTVNTNEELKAALTADVDGDIIVKLGTNLTYDVAAWDKNAMGGENTGAIIIDGNGNTLTFNQTDSDWNNVATNGAKLYISNAVLTNSGHNAGPWNRHDINFACDVELNNVTSDKALAFKAGATLNNVTINDANTSDTYAIWVRPVGQTININGLTVDMIACTDGRGIKIDNQYLGAGEEAVVTLNIKNATIKTEEKSAILVKTTVGAVINVDNVNIEGVAADNTNAVWVDSDAAAYADKVVVNGATVIVEP